MHENHHRHTGTKFRLQQKTLGLHLNKLQALSFVLASAVLSIGAVFLTSKNFF